MRARTILAAAAAAVIPLTGLAGTARAAVPRAAGLQASTVLTDRPDSGNGGTWAADSLSRTLTLTLVSDSAGTWTYTATVSDTGSCMTIGGALTPNQSGQFAGMTVLADAPCSVQGGASYSFTASAPADMSLVPVAEDGAPVTSQQTTSLWYELAFPAGTVFGGAGIGDWSWSYAISPFTYPHLGLYRQWTDSSSNGDGNEPGDGNINV